MEPGIICVINTAIGSPDALKVFPVKFAVLALTFGNFVEYCHAESYQRISMISEGFHLELIQPTKMCV